MQGEPLFDMLAGIKVSVAKLRLYPKDSPQVLKVATEAYEAVTTVLHGDEKLSLSRTPRGLLLNGGRIPHEGESTEAIETSMLALLAEAQIKSITFKTGLAIQELVSFLHAMSRKFWDVKEGKEINRRLRDEQVFRISVDEVQYVAVGEGDLVIEDAAARIQGGSTKLAQLVRGMDQVIESALAQGVGEELRLHIMKKLLEKDPALLDKSVDGVDSDQKGDLVFDDARKALGDLSRVIPMIPEKHRPVLEGVSHVLIDAFRDNAELAAMMKKFLSREASSLMPEWLRQFGEKRTGEPPAVARAKEIALMRSREQLRALTAEGPMLVKELDSLDRGDLVERLVTLVSGSLADSSADIRTEACRAFSAILDTVPATPEMERQITASLDAENDKGTYPGLTNLAVTLVDRRLHRGEFAEAMPLLQLLRRHYQVRDGEHPFRTEHAFNAMELVVGRAGFTFLLTKVKMSHPGALAALECLDAAAARPLITEIRTCDQGVQRRQIAEFIRRAGESASALLCEEVQKSERPSETLRLMEILPGTVPDRMTEMVATALLKNNVLAVRRRAVSILAERNLPHSGAILLGALRDEKDASIRETIIEGLGRLHFRDAAEVLRALAETRGESDSVRSAACIAMGRLGRDDLLPILTRLSSGSRGLTKILRSVPTPVRAAAVTALGGFPGRLEAQEALKKAQEDPDESVRSAANDALYSNLTDAFGELAREVQLVSAVQEVSVENRKLAGSLSEIPLDQISQLISTSEKTGLLLLHFNGPVGRVYFENGLVTAADFDGRRDQDAFNAIASRPNGCFLFQPGEIAPERRLQSPVTSMLMEAFRVADEVREAS